MARGVQVYVVKNAPGRRSLGLSQALRHLSREGLLCPKDSIPIQLKTINDRRSLTGSIADDELFCHVTEDELLAELGNFKYDPSKKPLFLNNSGLNHHLTYGLLKRVAESYRGPFGVLVFDAHSDGVGSPVEPKEQNAKPRKLWGGEFWAQALRDIPKFHIVIYPDEDHGRVMGHSRHILEPYEAPIDRDSQLAPTILATLNGRSARGVKGLYLSIDLDCLGRRYIQTDYPVEDGTTPEFLIETIEKVASKFPIIGADICGLSRKGVNKMSLQTFARIYQSLEGILAA